MTQKDRRKMIEGPLVIHALLGSLPWQYLAQFVDLTKWAKEGWHNDFAEVKDEQYANLVSLFNLMDALPEPHQAWKRYLTACSRMINENRQAILDGNL